MKKSVLILCVIFSYFYIPTISAQTFNYAEALQKSIYFYDAQKCGAGINGGHLEWRGDCHTEDKSVPSPFSFGPSALDFSGGFHDAGDHVKFGLTQGYAASTLGWGYYEFKHAFIQTGTQEHMLEILKWFSDYFLKCAIYDTQGNLHAFIYMVGDPSVDHSYWGPPELQKSENYNRPIHYASASSPASDMCASAAAALALMYLNYKEINYNYAQLCLLTAIDLYYFGVQYRGAGNTGGYYNQGYDEDDLSWAAVWLFVATGDIKYIRHIDSFDINGRYTGYMKKIIPTTANSWLNIWVHSWDNVWAGVFTKLSGLFPDNLAFDSFSRWNLEYWSGGIIPHQNPEDNFYLDPTPHGFAVINTTGSARYNAAAQLCCLVYQKYHHNRTDFADWSKTQINYILGNNPMNYSYVAGYGNKSVEHPHHRAAHGSVTFNMYEPENHRHILWGALVGGPDNNDYHEDNIYNSMNNSVGIDYNAGLIGALAGHYLLYGQGNMPVPGFPPLEPVTPEIFTEANIDYENNSTQANIIIHNQTIHPPRYHEGISCRYFINISEMIAAGQTIADLHINRDLYDEASILFNEKETIISDPVAFDEPNGIYYIDFAWTGIKFYNKLQIQFLLEPKQDSQYQYNWDTSNDFSREGLTTNYIVSENIPVYLDGVLFFGNEPDIVPTPVPTSVPTETPEPGSTTSPTSTPGSEPTPNPTFPTPSPPDYLPGDASKNGTVDILDALLIAQYYVNYQVIIDLKAADVNCDFVVDINDALIVARYYIGLIQYLPYCEYYNNKPHSFF